MWGLKGLGLAVEASKGKRLFMGWRAQGGLGHAKYALPTPPEWLGLEQQGFKLFKAVTH